MGDTSDESNSNNDGKLINKEMFTVLFLSG